MGPKSKVNVVKYKLEMQNNTLTNFSVKELVLVALLGFFTVICLRARTFCIPEKHSLSCWGELL